MLTNETLLQSVTDNYKISDTHITHAKTQGIMVRIRLDTVTVISFVSHKASVMTNLCKKSMVHILFLLLDHLKVR